MVKLPFRPSSRKGSPADAGQAPSQPTDTETPCIGGDVRIPDAQVQIPVRGAGDAEPPVLA